MSNSTFQAPTAVLPGGLQSVQVFTSSGTWTKPAGINKVIVEVLGGGAGGGYRSTGTNRNGGAGASGIVVVYEYS